MQNFKPIHLATLLVIGCSLACSDSSFTSAKTSQANQSSNATATPGIAPTSDTVGSAPSTDGAGGGGAAPDSDSSANSGNAGGTTGASATAPATPATPAIDPVIAKIPGVSVLKVGVNFEDTRAGDADYNDAVLCFEGGFKVDATDVVSTAKQQVIGTTFSSSDCTHQITVIVVSPDGTKSKPFVYDSKTTAKVPMSFGIGDKLEVSMVSQGCNKGVVKSMHSAQDAKVLPDVCNNK